MRVLPLFVAAATLIAACGGESFEETAPATAVDADVTATDNTNDTDTATTGDVFVPADSGGRVSLPAAASSTTINTTTPTSTSSTLPPTTTAATTTSTTTTSTTIASTTTVTATPTTTTVPTTTVPVTPDAAPGFDFSLDQIAVGTSIEGRPITAERFGAIGGRRVLVIGVIHGNEDAGVAIVDELRRRSIELGGPDGVELWLIESMNPDGQAAQDRHNANQVDLNRNFPHEWGPIGQPGDGQYAGTGPASEPETQAMVAFISQLAPDIAIWYHQDANLIIPSTGRQGRIRARYAELTGLPIADCCGGGIYTGIAATWARVTLSEQEAVPFIVELPGGELTAEQVEQHTTAVLTIATEG